jgi:hypothetical protein
MEEPGIPELLNLYLDDNYDYATGKFVGMNEKTQAQFKKDLKTFFTTFTGEMEMPESVKSFHDIKLKDYQKNCSSDKFKTPYTVSSNDEYFKLYANNIKQMMNRASTKQQELLSVINELFCLELEPYTNKKHIRVNKELTESKLQTVVEKTRRIIISLYVNCEKDYTEGIKLYETIVEMKIADSTKNQIVALTDQIKTLEE